MQSRLSDRCEDRLSSQSQTSLSEGDIANCRDAYGRPEGTYRLEQSGRLHRCFPDQSPIRSTTSIEHTELILTQSASRCLSLCRIMTPLSQFQHATICSNPLLKALRCESSDLCPSAHTSQVMPRQGVSDPRDKRTITMPDRGVKHDRSVNETLLECRGGQSGQFVLTSGSDPKRPWKSAKGDCQ